MRDSTPTPPTHPPETLASKQAVKRALPDSVADHVTGIDIQPVKGEVTIGLIGTRGFSAADLSELPGTPVQTTTAQVREKTGPLRSRETGEVHTRIRISYEEV
jgi:hypothetical protein